MRLGMLSSKGRWWVGGSLVALFRLSSFYRACSLLLYFATLLL